MRKSILAILLLMSVLLVFCAACGGSDEPAAAVSATMAPTPEPTEEPEPTPEPTEEPEVTPEPEEETDEEAAEETEEAAEETEESGSAANNSGNGTNSSNSSNNSNNTQSATPQPTEEPQVDKFAVAQTMQGRSVEDLYAAIGRPNGSDYTTSCLVFDGQDGLLYYDGFTVSTVQYADGTELVMGAY